MSKDIKRRSFPIKNLRAEDTDSGRTVSGYAATFGSVSESFRERIAPGAFAEAVDRDDVKLLVNHDANLILGRTKSGTLRLEEDDIGLRFSADLPDTQLGRDIAVLMERGDLSEMSFAFTEEDTEIIEDILVLKKVRLFDVAIVAFPAYEGTMAIVRDLAKDIASRVANQNSPEGRNDNREDRAESADSVAEGQRAEAYIAESAALAQRALDVRKTIHTNRQGVFSNHG